MTQFSNLNFQIKFLNKVALLVYFLMLAKSKVFKKANGIMQKTLIYIILFYIFILYRLHSLVIKFFF